MSRSGECVPMYKLCATERSAQNQKRLESAFLNLALQQNYDGITISAICREAELSRKVFYRLFENKNDVLYALIDHTLAAMEAYRPEQTPMYRFFSFWKEQKPLLDAMDLSQCNALLMDRVVRFALNNHTTFLWDLSPQLMQCDRNALIFYISGIFGMMLDWHVRGYDSSIEEMSRKLVTLLTVPLYCVP